MGAMADKLKAAFTGLIVIVAGVLIALAGDAAWAERKARLREREILTDLVAEFRDNELRLRTDIASNRQALAASEEWAEGMLAPSSLSEDSLATLYIAGNSFARFDPSTGALRSLIDGGELNIIQDDDLRRMLAGWDDRAGEATKTAGAINDNLTGLFAVHLAMSPRSVRDPGASAAVRLFPEFLRSLVVQMERLLVDLQDVTVRIEAELTP